MRKSFFAFCLSLAFVANTKAQYLTDFLKNTNTLMSKYASMGRFDYVAVKGSPELLQKIVDNVAEMDLSNAKPLEKKAFYINAYNVFMIKQVVDHYPCKTVKDVADFFAKKFKIAGEEISLDDIESTLAEFNDVRVYFAINKGAKGWTKINGAAFMPSTIEKQLDGATKLALDDNLFLKLQGDKVLLSEMIKGYQSEIESQHKSLQAFINKYRTTKLPKGASFDYYSFDWGLNEKKK